MTCWSRSAVKQLQRSTRTWTFHQLKWLLSKWFTIQSKSWVKQEERHIQTVRRDRPQFAKYETSPFSQQLLTSFSTAQHLKFFLVCPLLEVLCQVIPESKYSHTCRNADEWLPPAESGRCRLWQRQPSGFNSTQTTDAKLLCHWKRIFNSRV